MLIWNPGVKCAYFRLEIALAIHHASAWAIAERGTVYVTSMNDREHGARSLHAFDLAVDLGVAGNLAAPLEQLHGYLARVLPAGFDVVLEADHVHVEWDAHRALKPA